MASIVLLSMSPGEPEKAARIAALRAAHELRILEPRWPECQSELPETRPALVIVDASHAPSHARTVAGWMSSQARYRTVPFLFVDVPDRDVAKVKREVPRAQFSTWASIVGTSERLARGGS